MNSSTLTLAARLVLDSQRWAQGLNGAQGKIKSFVSGAKREVDHLRGALNTIPGALASIGIGFSSLDAIRKSAGLDQSLTRMGQNAGATRAEIDGMRLSLMRMAKDSGKEVEELAAGMDVLIAGNLDPKGAVTVLSAINKEARITGAGMDDLGKALMVMSTNFGLNVRDGDAVTKMLEKMTVAGRKGFVELNNLADVIPRVAVHAKNAGMDDNTMLAFLETLSNAEQDPSKLSTLAESTLRLFNNPQYRKKVTKATGVKFTDKNDELRPVEDIFTELQSKYAGLTTGGQRQRFAGNVFGEMDITTQTGVVTMLDKNLLGQMASNKAAIRNSAGQMDADYSGAMNNSVAQSGVLKATLREAMDQYSRPINSALTEAIKFTTSKDGLNMSGGEMLGASAAGTAATYALTRGLPPMLQKAFGGTASLGTGAVMGNVLKDAGVATPVFIVGAAPGVMGDGGVSAVAGGSKGKGGWKSILGWSIPTALAGSMLLDPRNQKLGEGIPELSAKWKQDNDAKGGHWMTRGGLPSLNFISDLIGGLKDKKADILPSGLKIDVNVNDGRSSVVVTPEGGQASVRTLVGGPGTRPRTGLMMPQAAGGGR